MTTNKKSPPSGKDVVYIDHDDEITSVIDKVEASKQKIVALVLPKRFTTLQSIVNMRLLKRAAEKSGKNPVLITGEEALLPLAGAAGLHVAKNLQSKPEIPPEPASAVDAEQAADEEQDPDKIDEKNAKLDHHRAIGTLAAVKVADEAIDLDNEEKPDLPGTKPKKNKKLKVPDFDRFRLGLGIVGVILIALVIFLFLANRVLPKANVTIDTSSDKVAAEFNVSTSDKIDQLNAQDKTVPAQIKKSDQTATTTVQATGQKNNGKKASGSVKLSIPCANVNGSPPKVPAGSAVTQNGLVYITSSSATLDNPDFSNGCKFTDSTNITAQTAGSNYNTGDGTSFSVVGYSNLSASGSASGGSDDITKVLSDQDVESAKKTISSADSDNYSKKFQEDLKAQGYYVVQSTLKLSDPTVTTDKKVGEATDRANATVKITYSALVIQKSDLEKLINNALGDQIDKKKQELSNKDVLSQADVTVVSLDKGANGVLNVSVESTAVPKIDQALIKQQIGGKKEGEIKAIISSWPGVKDVKVKMSPFWVSKAPKNSGKITIKLVQVPQNNNQSSNGE